MPSPPPATDRPQACGGGPEAARLRVLHVLASGRRRGAEIFAADLIPRLGAAGLDQRVVVLQGPTPPAVDFGAPVTVALAGRSMAGWLDGARVLRRLRRVVRSWRPDVVQAHGGDALKLCVGAVAGTPTPVVYRNIGLAAPWALAGLRLRFWRLLVRRAAWTVALADTVRLETVVRFGAPAERVTTIENGVDPERVAPARPRARVREELGVPAGAAVLLSLAALTWEKDPLVHVEVGEAVLAELPTAVHLLAGDGPMRQRVAAEVTRRGLAARMRLLGSRTDVADLLHASDVLLFASRADGMEGMPTVLIEAGMAGVAAVAYAVAGAAEVVVDGESGRLVEPGDTAALADAAKELLRDAERRRSMGARAAQRCRGRFDVRAQVPLYVEIYRTVASRRATPARRR